MNEIGKKETKRKISRIRQYILVQVIQNNVNYMFVCCSVFNEELNQQDNKFDNYLKVMKRSKVTTWVYFLAFQYNKMILKVFQIEFKCEQKSYSLMSVPLIQVFIMNMGLLLLEYFLNPAYLGGRCLKVQSMVFAVEQFKLQIMAAQSRLIRIYEYIFDSKPFIEYKGNQLLLYLRRNVTVFSLGLFD